MPDNTTAVCYAEVVAERVAQAAYPEGFGHHYWVPSALNQPKAHTQPAGIFFDSMADMMGSWVPAEQIEAVLDVCRETPQHVYFLLTKNAPRLLQFKFPPNVWIGVSAPPSIMRGNVLTHAQQIAYLKRAFEVLAKVDVPVRWLSAEPLSFDMAELVKGAPIQWCVIGAATNGQQVYQPKPEWVSNLIQVLREQNASVFFKGNLKGCAAAEPWLEEFPPVTTIASQKAVQDALF